MRTLAKKKFHRNGHYYRMRQKRAAEIEAVLQQNSDSTDEEHAPPPEFINAMFNEPSKSSASIPSSSSSSIASIPSAAVSSSPSIEYGSASSEDEIEYEKNEYLLQYELEMGANDKKINLTDNLRQWALQNKITFSNFPTAEIIE